eukprot:CAMPEP_0117600340 /NCGR_PEP_ID=MMETSP0784-20121206/76437_1 /TAXON_ID=39447 /ORGANISM="" /LENGTH=90 /DNA_ID=CAMNT_0005402969 /DNA_START=116 /DNA_END=388 /DNA_ORIENTATION=+
MSSRLPFARASLRSQRALPHATDGGDALARPRDAPNLLGFGGRAMHVTSKSVHYREAARLHRNSQEFAFVSLTPWPATSSRHLDEWHGVR